MDLFSRKRARPNLSPKAGVYILWQGGKVIYVGQSEDVRKRIFHHRKTRSFDMVQTVLVKDEEKRLVLERWLILTLRPTSLKQKVRPGKIKTDIRKALWKEYQHSHRENFSVWKNQDGGEIWDPKPEARQEVRAASREIRLKEISL